MRYLLVYFVIINFVSMESLTLNFSFLLFPSPWQPYVYATPFNVCFVLSVHVPYTVL